MAIPRTFPNDERIHEEPTRPFVKNFTAVQQYPFNEWREAHKQAFISMRDAPIPLHLNLPETPSMGVKLKYVFKLGHSPANVAFTCRNEQSLHLSFKAPAISQSDAASYWESTGIQHKDWVNAHGNTGSNNGLAMHNVTGTSKVKHLVWQTLEVQIMKLHDKSLIHWDFHYAQSDSVELYNTGNALTSINIHEYKQPGILLFGSGHPSFSFLNMHAVYA